jgi:hypothetical protein
VGDKHAAGLGELRKSALRAARNLRLEPTGTGPEPLWHTKLGNFAPRIGATYQIASETVVRGGYGLFSHGLQALASYNLAKSSDLGSSDENGLAAPSVREIVLSALPPSDFDIRHSFAVGVSYEIPSPSWGRGKAIFGGLAVDGLVRVSSAPPINATIIENSPSGGVTFIQANIVPGQPYWIADPTQPSGKALNPAAFTSPAAGQTGNFPRNGLRSPYSIDQTDLALRRQFNLTERLKLDVRAEYFNVFNHPMFGIAGSSCNPDAVWGRLGGSALASFGKVCPGTSTTNIDGGGGNGQNALYSFGGPRSAQFTVKLHF